MKREYHVGLRRRGALHTINAAIAFARPGDTIIVHAGVYRERVDPRCDGVTLEAAEGESVFLRGSEPFAPVWRRRGNVWEGALDGLPLGARAYGGLCDPALYGEFNPYRLAFNRNRTARPHTAVLAALRAQLGDARRQARETAAGADLLFSRAQKRLGDLQAEWALRTGKNPRHVRTLGQVFVDGAPLVEVETEAEVQELPGTWMVAPDGEAVWVNTERPAGRLVELSVRHTVISPLKRRLGHITVRGFTIEHAANHFPCWGATGWAQAGMFSTRTGHHWVIENNIIRYAKGLGVDCGSEGGRERMENRGELAPDKPHAMEDWSRAGHHVIRNNDISDNGHCGLAGIGHVGTQVIGNRIERNNRDGWTSPWWEFGGIKFHFFYDGRIEGNLIRDNEAHGIWIDNQWRGSRITRNTIVNNLWSGINVELGRGPVLIDNNVIALTRQGDGIYGHDVADVTLAHNLLYANAGFGVWFAYATPRVKAEDGCWDIRTLNNLILGNRVGAIAYPMPWQRAGRNVSDGNLFMGGGEYLDEGSGSRPPLFQFTNATHMANMPEHHPKGLEAQSPARVRQVFARALKAAGVARAQWPNLATWAPHYLVSLDLWRAVLGNDRHSREMSGIRDGLQSRVLSVDLAVGRELAEVTCRAVPGADHDFDGRRRGAKGLCPGPFLGLKPGSLRRLLWPIRKASGV